MECAGSSYVIAAFGDKESACIFKENAQRNGYRGVDLEISEVEFRGVNVHNSSLKKSKSGSLKAKMDKKQIEKMALEYWSMDEKFHVDRTKKYMDLGSKITDLQNELEGLQRIIQNGKPFSNLEHNQIYSNYRPATLRDSLNNFSCEALFDIVSKQALRDATFSPHSREQLTNGPNICAAAWIKHFGKYDADSCILSPNKNWNDYYKENYEHKTVKSK